MKVKKILLTLGISLIGIINITLGAGEFVGQGKIGQYVLNPIDGEYYVGVDKNFNLKSIHNGIGKNIFVVYTGTLWGFYVANDSGKNISMYANTWRSDGPRGGKMTYYYLCDYVDDVVFNTNSRFSGCVQGNYGDAVNLAYISHLKVGDDYFFGNASINGQNLTYRRNPFIGFNISELNKSIVFYAKAEKSVNIGYGLPYDFTNQYGVNRLYYDTYDRDSFPGTLTYNNPYDLTLNGCIGDDCDTGENETNTGNIETSTGQKFCPLIQLDIDMYGRYYTSDLCWSNGTTTSGGEQIQTGYVNIFTAYPTYQDYLNSFNIYQTYCYSSSPRYDREDCINNLQALPYGRGGATITRNAIKRELPPKKVYQYCRLQTHFTEEQKRGSGRCQFTEEEYYAPGLLSGATTEDEINQLKQEAGANTVEGLVDGLLTFGDNGTYITPEDGSIFDDILPDGIISWKELINVNFIGNLTQIIVKLLLLFKTRPIVDGILPPVILSLLLLIVLFKMYKK